MTKGINGRKRRRKKKKENGKEEDISEEVEEIKLRQNVSCWGRRGRNFAKIIYKEEEEENEKKMKEIKKED